MPVVVARPGTMWLTSRNAKWFDKFRAGRDMAATCTLRAKDFKVTDFGPEEASAKKLPATVQLDCQVVRRGQSALIKFDTSALARALGGGPSSVQMSAASGYWREGETFRCDGEKNGVHFKINFEIDDDGRVGIRDLQAFRNNGDWLTELISPGPMWNKAVVVGKLG